MTVDFKLKQWARKRSVRHMLRNAPYFVRGRQTKPWRRAWAVRRLDTWARHRKIHFYVIITYRVFNPRHNGGNGKWSNECRQRYGPYGPELPRHILERYATDDLVRQHVQSRYPHDVQVDVIKREYQPTNEPSVMEQAKVMRDVPLQSGNPIMYQYLRYGAGVNLLARFTVVLVSGDHTGSAGLGTRPGGARRRRPLYIIRRNMLAFTTRRDH